MSFTEANESRDAMERNDYTKSELHPGQSPCRTSALTTLHICEWLRVVMRRHRRIDYDQVFHAK